MDLVIVESPYAGNVKANLAYARQAMADCLKRGEAPYASHLLYTQEGVLDDEKPEDRKLGIAAGFEWGKQATKTVVYCDRGLTQAMAEGIAQAFAVGRLVEFRWLETGKTFTMAPSLLYSEMIKSGVGAD